MVKSPDKIVADIDAEQNKEDLDLPRRVGEVVVKGAKAVKDAVVDSYPVKTIRAMKDRYDASQMSVEKKAKGGKVSSASKRADGCAIRGKTRA